MQDKQTWAIDKKIPITLFLALCFQVGFSIFWVGGLSKDVDHTIFANTIMNHKIENHTDRIEDHGRRIVVLETEFKNINTLLTKIDLKLDRINK